MDISCFCNDDGVVPKDKYDQLYKEYAGKCDSIVPFGERYVVDANGMFGDVELAKGATFVIELAYTPSLPRIDIVVTSDCAPCIVFDDIDQLLDVLKTLKFSVYKQDVVEKLGIIKEESIKLFKMMQINDVELLLSLKTVFRTLERHAEIADYAVKINEG